MVELRQVFLADYFQVEPTGKFYITGGLNQVVHETYPSAIGDVRLLVSLDFDQGEDDPGLRVDLRLEGVKEALYTLNVGLKVHLPGAIPGSPTCHWVRVGLAEVVLPSPGAYYFDVYLADQLKQSLRFLAITPDIPLGVHAKL